MDVFLPAWAVAVAEAGFSGADGLGSVRVLLGLLALLAIGYVEMWLILRASRSRNRATIRDLVPGDRVRTCYGIRGTVVQITDGFVELRLTSAGDDESTVLTFHLDAIEPSADESKRTEP